MRPEQIKVQLPLDLGVVAALLQAISSEWPDAVLVDSDDESVMVIEVDADALR